MKPEFTLTSTAFTNGGQIPAKYTCDGENINPPLKINNPPEGTQSFILIMDDPDAPMGTWDHWITFNIPATTTEIIEGHEPGGISAKGTSGNLDYFGPCPPDGEHRYFFRLFALDNILDLEEGINREELEEAMNGHIIAKTEIFGVYKR